ncbi:MAG: CBS domain-containing protein [Desulfatibacillaceae bacterium]
MRVRTLMVADPITVSVKTPVDQTIAIMRDHSIRHLPVVDAGNRLVGWATMSDLRQGLIPSMVANLNLADIMVRTPYTIGPDDDVEDAAQLIYLKKIGGLPVVEKDGTLVGVLTVTDLLRAFIEMMGLLTQSWRLDIDLAGHEDGFREVTRIIQENGGRVLSVAMASHRTDKEIVYVRLAGGDLADVRDALCGAGYEVQ